MIMHLAHSNMLDLLILDFQFIPVHQLCPTPLNAMQIYATPSII